MTNTSEPILHGTHGAYEGHSFASSGDVPQLISNTYQPLLHGSHGSYNTHAVSKSKEYLYFPDVPLVRIDSRAHYSIHDIHGYGSDFGMYYGST